MSLSKRTLSLLEPLSDLLLNGLSIKTALELLAENTTLKLRTVLFDIISQIDHGRSFSQSMKKHCRYFSSMDCTLIKAAEETGQLPSVVNELVRYHLQHLKTINQLKKSLTYPCIVLCVSLVITFGLLLGIVPQFESLFQSVNQRLPTITLFVLSLSRGIQHHWLSGALTASIFAMSCYYWLKFFPMHRRYIENAALNTPLLNHLLMHAHLSQMFLLLSLTQQQQIPLSDALDWIIQSVRFITLKFCWIRTKTAVLQGSALSKALKTHLCISPIMITLLTVGEETGQLGKQLSKVASYYENKNASTTQFLLTLLEPCLMVFLAILCGTLILAMYLPIFSLSQTLR